MIYIVIILIVLVPIIVALVRKFKINLRGKVGEMKVDSKLNPLLFDKVEHRQINDLVLMDDNGKTHQIDHIEIRENGIFCIETKNYKGVIMGSENQEYWTQCLYNKERYKMINPIRQNKSHIYHLNKLLGGRYKIISLIVMVQNNADTIDVPYVVNLEDMREYLLEFDDGTRYSKNDMDTIYDILISNQASVTKKEHIRNIEQTNKNLSNMICPRCGKNLVLRESAYGKFYGCSGFPNCTFKKNKIN